MNLKDFIRIALVDISNGTLEADRELAGTGAVVNPKGLQLHTFGNEVVASLSRGPDFPPMIDLVAFDIAVTAAEGMTAKGGGKLNVLAVQVGGDTTTEQTFGKVSRIRFRIPILLPQGQSPFSAK